MSASDLKKLPRYYVQWVTVHHPEENGIAQLQVKALRIRDSHMLNFPIVFEHADPIVVQKILTILNEG
jgi:capsule polysaccharide export protein KpsE/RkpR